MKTDLPQFATLDEAIAYFQDDPDVSQKYGVMVCYVGDRFTCLMGTAMAEDNYTRGPIEAVVEKFLTEIGAPCDIDDATLNCGAEMTGVMYDVLAEHGIDVEFVYDEF